MRSDDELMADPRGVPELIRRYDRPLLDYFRHNLLDEHRAQDLKQETLLRVHRDREKFAGKGKFRSWIFRIAHNLLVDEWRRRKVRLERPLTDEPDERPDPPAVAVKDETLGRVYRALRQLPTAYREALVLAYFDRVPYAEIADLLGISLGNVAVRVHTALTFLKEKIL